MMNKLICLYLKNKENIFIFSLNIYMGHFDRNRKLWQ